MSDEETVEAITENPYLQYFIGLHSFQQVAPFHASSLTHFRKPFDVELVNGLNKSIVLEQRKKDERDHDDEPPNGAGHASEEHNLSSSTESMPPPNQGKLLLNKSREELE